MFGETVTRSAGLGVRIRVEDGEAELLSVEGNDSDVRAFKEEWDRGNMQEFLFPDGVPTKGPSTFKLTVYLEWVHTHTTNGEDWDCDVVVTEWDEVQDAGLSCNYP